MNRTQHLTTSQPRPKRRVARPGACSLGVVASTASAAANDSRMGLFDGPLVDHSARTVAVSVSDASGTACRAAQSPEAEVDLIKRFAAKFDRAWKLPRRIAVDNGAEFHGTEAADLHAALLPPSAKAANKSTRGAA